MQYKPHTLTAIAAASLLAAFAAQANKGADYKPHHHKEHHKNFFITGGATYLEPSYTGLDYAGIYTDLGGPYSIDGEAVEPGFDWGYFIQAGYRISHHYDVEASWAQFNSSLSDSTAVSSPNSLIASNFYAVPLFHAASSTQDLNYSIFDANLGQYHDITEMLRARIFAGIRYAKIDADIDNTYTYHDIVGFSTEDYDSSFSGVGPEVGFDLEYKIWHTVGVVGHLAGAFLVGNQDAKTTAVIDGDVFPSTSDSSVRLVPGMDAKLGLNWNVPYAYEKVAFGIEAGYEVAYYWDAIELLNQEYATATTFNINHNYQNYGNMGPYLNFTAMF